MIDARGLSCPMPVVLVQNEVKKSAPPELTVLVDAVCSAENITRFAQNHGYAVTRTAQGSDMLLTLRRI